MFAMLGIFALILVAIYTVITICSMIADGENAFLGSFLLLLFGLPLALGIFMVIIALT